MNNPSTAGIEPRDGRPDEVDELVAAWHRERPDLDLSPLDVLSRVTRVAKRLDRLRRSAFAAHNLETWEFDVLAALRRSGEPYQMSPGVLAQATMVTSGTMTNRVDRLMERGLVERTPSTVDRRRVHIRLSTAGRELVDSALRSLLEAERPFLGERPGYQPEELAAQLRHLLSAFDDADTESSNGIGTETGPHPESETSADEEVPQ